MTTSSVIGVLGSLVLAAAAIVPQPFGVAVGLVGFLLSSIAGLSVPAPSISAGKPILQGAALAVATGLFGLVSQLYQQVPVGIWQSVTLFGIGVLAWLTGSALPALGAVTPPPGEPIAAPPLSREKAIELILKGPHL